MNDDYKSQILSYRETIAATPVPISDPAIDDRKDSGAGELATLLSQYATLVRLNSPEAKKAEKEALDAIWMERLEKFKGQSELNSQLASAFTIPQFINVQMATY